MGKTTIGDAAWHSPGASSALATRTEINSAGTENYDDSRPVTAAEVAAIVNAALAGLKIYVLESEITEAQNSVKSVVEQTYF
mgnify:CR=1 FL=1